jgi:hypothetical protein
LTEALSAYRQCNGDFEALQLERHRARKQDDKARVEAYRSGKPDPGTQHEAKVLAKLEELRDRQSVLEAAYVEVERDISMLVSQKRTEWLPKLEDLVRDDDEELAILLEQVGAVIKRRQAHAGLHEWMGSLAPACTPKAYAADGLSENTALGFLISTIGQSIKSDGEGLHQKAVRE